MADYSAIIEDAGKRRNVDPRLISAVIGKESSGNAGAINSSGGGKGAYGLMQVREPALIDYNRANGTKYTMQDLLRPDVGVDVGTWYLGQQLDRHKDPSKALIAYNQGPNSAEVAKGGSEYSRSVMKNMGKPQNLPGVPSAADSDAEALFQQRFGAAPAKSADDAEAIFAQRFGSAVNAATKPAAAAPVPSAAKSQYTREWAQKNPVEFQKALEAGKISPEDYAAIRGESGGFKQGLGEAIGGVLQRGAHTLAALGIIPDQAASGIDKQLQTNSKAYEAARGDKGIDIGRAIGGTIPALAVSGGPVSGLPSLIAQGARVGATSGLMQPVLDVPEGSTYGKETAKNVGINALVGGAVPVAMAGAQGAGRYVGNVAKSFIEPFTEKGQEAIAGRVLGKFAGNAAGDASQYVPGSIPRLSEATGNAGIGALERGLASSNTEFANQLAERVGANNAARVNALQQIAGSDVSRATAIDAREAATKPLYELATSKSAPVDDAFNALMNRPSMQKAIERAKAIAKEQGTSFSLGQKGRPSLAGEGVPKVNISDVRGNDLQTLKMAMDDLLQDPASGIVGKEANAVRSTRNALVNWMENKIPEFQAAREQYSELSKPIAQMDVAQRLLQKFSSATQDLAGNPKLRAEAYNRALQDESKLLKNSGAFSGYRGLKDVFTPEQLSTIKGVAKDLSRSTVGTNAGRPVGSNTFQNLATQNMLESAIPGRVGQFLGGAGPGTLGGITGGGLGFAVGGFPGAAAGAIMGERAGNIANRLMASQNEAIQARLGNMLLNGQMPAAAVRNVNPLLNSRAIGYINPAIVGLSSESLIKSPTKTRNNSNSRD